MTLHRAVSHLGLLNASLPLPVCSPKGCRLLAMGNVLYCFYLGDGNEVMMTSRLATGAWSVPVDLKFPSLSGLPAVYGYNGRIHVFTSAEANNPITRTNGSKVLHWQSGEDIRIHLNLSMNVFGSPSVAELNGKLYVFWREPGYGELRWGNSTTGIDWLRQGHVHPEGQSRLARSLWDPVVCTYQRLLHVFYQSEQGLSLIRFDGDSGWSRGQLLVDKPYHCMPAVFVHDGLLTLAYANLQSADQTLSVTAPTEQSMGDLHDGDVEGTLDLYRYDGNVLGRVDRSIGMVVKGVPAAAVVDGELNLIFPSV
ncbi:hypothetical protein ACIPZG_24660 [Pseudomonas sp. NPDC089395]|uniref:hypothetical protein n=1 Tax=Pseudomonas sp. NPDC089395 TaxID=3364460 RepID=UPI0037F3F498